MTLPSGAMLSRTYPIRNVQLGNGLNLTEPRVRVASGSQEDPVHHRRADEEARREFEVVAPRPEPGAPGIPLSTEALAACGDSLKHLRRRIAVSLSRLVCPASTSTIVEEQEDLKRRMDEYKLHKDYHWSVRGEDAEGPIKAIGSPPKTDMDTCHGHDHGQGHGTLAARSRGRADGGGTAPDTRRPSQWWQATPPGDGSSPPPRHAAPTGHAGQGDSVGLPHPHTRAHSTWVADPNSPPQWAGSRGRDSAWPQTPLTMMEGTPPGDALPPPPQRATPARKDARCGAGAGSPRPYRPHPGHRVAEPWLPTPEDGRPGEGQRLTPGTPHNGGRHPPGGRYSATPTASNAGPQGRTLWDRCWVPTPAPTAPGTHGSRNPGRPLQRTGGRGWDSA